MATQSAQAPAAGSDVVVDKGPCPKCGSKDNLVTYADGHKWCFTPGCGAAGLAEGEERERPKLGKTPTDLIRPERADAFDEMADRRLKSDTLRRYGYFRGHFKPRGASGPIGVHVAPYHDDGGNVVAQKLRLPSKEFIVLKAEGAPSLSQCQLFGQAFFGDRFDREVIVTEGEIDAMSVAQTLGFKKPVVSVNVGAEVVKCLQHNYRWLDRFQSIVFFFDDDQPGRDAAEEAAKLFAVGKVRIARLHGHKDASEALQRNKPGDIEAAIYSATTWRPRGIVNAADCLADVTEDDTTPSWSFPWEGLQGFTRGAQPGEVVYHVAGTGIGKTTALNEIAYHLISRERVKVGWLGFEVMRRDVQLGLLSVHTSRRLSIDPMPREDLAAAHRAVFGSRMVELFDPETAEWSVEAILGYVRYMAKALECQVLFVDPLSFIAAGLSLGDDERRTLDKASRDLAALAKELAITPHISHHLRRTDGKAHEEGGETSLNQVRGSGGIANFASIVIGYERNQQGERPDLTRVRVLKNRRSATTGVASVLKWDAATGRLAETAEAWPSDSDDENRSAGGGGGFGRASSVGEY